MKTKKQHAVGPRSLANLVKWQKGQSGNLSGRPKKKPLTERYEQMFETQIEEKMRLKLGLPVRSTYGDAIALGMARAAVKGNPNAASEMREAVEGKAVETEGLSAIKVIVIDSRHRPDWDKMRKVNTIELPPRS